MTFKILPSLTFYKLQFEPLKKKWNFFAFSHSFHYLYQI